MRRMRELAAVAVIVLVAAPVAGATHDPDHIASGRWDITFQVPQPGRDNTADLRLVTVAQADATRAAAKFKFTYAEWALGECNGAAQYVVGAFSRGPKTAADLGDVVGCTTSNGLFYAVMKSTRYADEEGLDGTLGAIMEYRILPTGQSSEVVTTFAGHFKGDGSVPERISVDYKVIARGKPNVPGLTKNRQALVTSRLTTSAESDGAGGASNATFAPQTGTSLWRASATKGWVVQEDVYSDGTTSRIVFGTHEGSLYDPGANRLAIYLVAAESDDPNCPVGAGALLVIVPQAGVADSVLFLGSPVSRTIKISFGLLSFPITIKPCKLRSHGWRPASGVNVRVRITHKP